MRARGAQANCAGPACAPQRGTIRAHPGASGPSPLPVGGRPTPSHPVLSCRGPAAASTAHRAPGEPRGICPTRGAGVQVETPRGRAGGPAAPGQTPRMPVGFRPHFPGVSALRPKRAGRAQGGSPGWEMGRSGWGGRRGEFGAGERPGRKQQGPGTHPAPSPACDPVWWPALTLGRAPAPCRLGR